jgi:hypothetical protein
LPLKLTLPGRHSCSKTVVRVLVQQLHGSADSLIFPGSLHKLTDLFALAPGTSLALPTRPQVGSCLSL